MGGIGLPQQEVRGVPLARLVGGAHASAFAGAERLEAVAGEPPVRGEGLHVEVDRAVTGHVGTAVGHEPLHEFDHLRHEPGRTRHQRGIALGLLRDRESEPPRVLEEPRRVEVGDRVGVARIDRSPFRQGSGLLGLEEPPPGEGHLVLAAAIGAVVLGHVAHVGDVHHMNHAMAKQLERAAKQVRREERPEVSHVGVVVDGRAAGVEGHRSAGSGERLEALDRAGQGVVEVQARGHLVSVG